MDHLYFNTYNDVLERTINAASLEEYTYFKMQLIKMVSFCNYMADVNKWAKRVTDDYKIWAMEVERRKMSLA